MPVSAIAKLAPLIATLADRNSSAQVRAGRHRQPARVVGEVAGSTPGISRRKISRISARLRWIAGTRMCERLVVAELHDQLGQVGLDRARCPAASRASLSPISWVAIDLTLTTSSRAGRRVTSSVTIALASSASRAQCTTPPRAVTSRFELLEQLRQPAMDVGLDRRAGVAQLLPVGALRRRPQPASSRIVVVAWPRLRRSCVFAERRAGRVRERSRRRAGCRHRRARRYRLGRPRKVSLIGAPAATSVAARISARCTVRTPVRSRERPPPMCIRHDESPAVHDLGAGGEHVAHLVGEHRRRGVGVLDRERAAEAAARVGAGQLDQVDAAHGAQQPQRLVADAQHPQRVAGRVVGDPVRVVRADVGHAEHVDEQLGQLVGPRRDCLGTLGQLSSPVLAGDHRVLVPDRADTRARRRDHGVTGRQRSSNIST